MGIGPFQQGDVRARKVGVLTAQVIAAYDLCRLTSGNALRAEDETWGSAIATPSAPTVANGAVAVGSPLTNSATGVKVSIQFPWGEGTLSAAGTATPTAAALLKVTLAALPAPGLYWNIYIEDSAGSGTYKLWGISYTAAILMIPSYGTGRVPPTAVAQGALEITQNTFAQAFIGISHQRKDAAVARCYGASEDNMIQMFTGGVYLMDCASATFAVGDAVGPAKDTGNTLVSQTVVGVAHISLGIGYVSEAGTSITKVKVEVVSKKMPIGRPPMSLAA